jgi:copper chaperone CopZ
MKNLLKTGAFLLLLVAGRTQAQESAQSNFASVDIHSNAVCDMCQTTIQTEMLYVKGVQAVKVDLDSNIIHVEYKAEQDRPGQAAASGGQTGLHGG